MTATSPSSAAVRLWRRAALLLPLLFLCLAGPAAAHRTGESYVYFDVTDTELTGRFEVQLTDLDAILVLDQNGNGVVEEKELRTGAGPVFEFMSSRLELTHDGQALPLSPGPVDVLDAGTVGMFGQIGFSVGGLDTVPERLTVRYRPLTLISTDHAGYVLIGSNSRVGLVENEAYISLSFPDETNPPQELNLMGTPWRTVHVQFLRHGALAAATSVSFLAAVVALMLPLGLRAQGPRWVPERRLEAALQRCSAQVLVLAAALVLTFGVTSLLALPLDRGLVLAGAAGTASLLALLNFLPIAAGLRRPAIALAGLALGLAFAAALSGIPHESYRAGAALLGFGTGLLLAVLALVLPLFVLAWQFRYWTTYRVALLPLISAVALLLTATLVLEETTSFDLDMRAAVSAVSGLEL